MNLVLLPQCAFQKKGREGGGEKGGKGEEKGGRKLCIWMKIGKEWKEEKGICCTMPLKLARATPRLALPLNPTTFPL